MINKYSKILLNLEEQLQFLNIEFNNNNIVLSEKAISIILLSIKELNENVLKNNFKNIDEEINYFKNIKPKFISKLIYYNSVFKIESKAPYGGDIIVKKYFNNELNKLKKFFDNNLDFYRYYRTGSTYLDHKYFVRGKYDVKLMLDSFYFEADSSLSTSHDFKISKILANDLIQVYIEDKLLSIDHKEIKEDIKKVESKEKLNWTSSKVALIELIYALHSESVFNNGNSEIKEISEYFESVFNIQLGDYYRAYLELRMRKTSRTKFLTSLTESLIKKMDEADEK